MGILDLPAPVLSAIDGIAAGVLPAVVRLAAWGALTSVASMEFYRLVSPQARIGAAKQGFAQAQARLASFDGDFGEALPLMRTMFGAAFARLGLALPAALVAALPFLFVIVWVENQFGDTYPPEAAELRVTVPGDYSGRWDGVAKTVVVEHEGTTVAQIPVPHPVPVVHKRAWWNLLIGNPAGYLDERLAFDRVEIAMPRQEIIGAGPGWMRGWEAVFLASAIVFALAWKILRGIT